MPWQIAGGAAASALESIGATAKVGGQIWLNNLQSQIQANQLQASIEDRKQQWRSSWPPRTRMR